MTTYVAIPNADIDQDSPVTQTLMTALRDNPAAITEGAAGAPRIQVKALGDDVASGGTQNCLVDFQTYSTGAASWALVLRWSVYNGGSVRVGFRHRTSSGTCDAKVEKNGNVQSSWSTSSATYVDRQVAVNINSGDTLDIWVQTTGGTTDIDDLYMSTSGGFMIPAPIHFARGEPKWVTV